MYKLLNFVLHYVVQAISVAQCLFLSIPIEWGYHNCLFNPSYKLEWDSACVICDGSSDNQSPLKYVLHLLFPFIANILWTTKATPVRQGTYMFVSWKFCIIFIHVYTFGNMFFLKRSILIYFSYSVILLSSSGSFAEMDQIFILR